MHFGRRKRGRACNSSESHHVFTYCLRHTTLLKFLSAAELKCVRLVCLETRESVNASVSTLQVSDCAGVIQTELAAAFPHASNLKLYLLHCSMDFVVAQLKQLRQCSGKFLRQIRTLTVDYLHTPWRCHIGAIVHAIKSCTSLQKLKLVIHGNKQLLTLIFKSESETNTLSHLLASLPPNTSFCPPDLPSSSSPLIPVLTSLVLTNGNQNVSDILQPTSLEWLPALTSLRHLHLHSIPSTEDLAPLTNNAGISALTALTFLHAPAFITYGRHHLLQSLSTFWEAVGQLTDLVNLQVKGPKYHNFMEDTSFHVPNSWTQLTQLTHLSFTLINTHNIQVIGHTTALLSLALTPMSAAAFAALSPLTNLTSLQLVGTDGCMPSGDLLLRLKNLGSLQLTDICLTAEDIMCLSHLSRLSSICIKNMRSDYEYRHSHTDRSALPIHLSALTSVHLVRDRSWGNIMALASCTRAPALKRVTTAAKKGNVDKFVQLPVTAVTSGWLPALAKDSFLVKWKLECFEEVGGHMVEGLGKLRAIMLNMEDVTRVHNLRRLAQILGSSLCIRGSSDDLELHEIHKDMKVLMLEPYTHVAEAVLPTLTSLTRLRIELPVSLNRAMWMDELTRLRDLEVLGVKVDAFLCWSLAQMPHLSKLMLKATYTSKPDLVAPARRALTLPSLQTLTLTGLSRCTALEVLMTCTQVPKLVTLRCLETYPPATICVPLRACRTWLDAVKPMGLNLVFAVWSLWDMNEVDDALLEEFGKKWRGKELSLMVQTGVTAAELQRVVAAWGGRRLQLYPFDREVEDQLHRMTSGHLEQLAFKQLHRPPRTGVYDEVCAMIARALSNQLHSPPRWLVLAGARHIAQQSRHCIEAVQLRICEFQKAIEAAEQMMMQMYLEAGGQALQQVQVQEGQQPAQPQLLQQEAEAEQQQPAQPQLQQQEAEAQQQQQPAQLQLQQPEAEAQQQQQQPAQLQLQQQEAEVEQQQQQQHHGQTEAAASAQEPAAEEQPPPPILAQQLSVGLSEMVLQLASAQQHQQQQQQQQQQGPAADGTACTEDQALQDIHELLRRQVQPEQHPFQALHPTPLHLSALSSSCPSLRHLCLHHCAHLDNAALLQLAQRCVSLERLVLRDAAALTATSLTHLRTHCALLQELHISGAWRIMGGPAIDLLLASRSLRVLELLGSGLRRSVVKEVQRRLPIDRDLEVWTVEKGKDGRHDRYQCTAGDSDLLHDVGLDVAQFMWNRTVYLEGCKGLRVRFTAGRPVRASRTRMTGKYQC